MSTSMIFQYVAPGSLRPDDMTVTDQSFIVKPDTVLPNVGDFVALPFASGKKEGDRGRVNVFKVAARHYYYTLSDPLNGQGDIVHTEIYILITDAHDREVGYITKQ